MKRTSITTLKKKFNEQKEQPQEFRKGRKSMIKTREDVLKQKYNIGVKTTQMSITKYEKVLYDLKKGYFKSINQFRGDKLVEKERLKELTRIRDKNFDLEEENNKYNQLFSEFELYKPHQSTRLLQIENLEQEEGNFINRHKKVFYKHFNVLDLAKNQMQKLVKIK